MTKRSWFLTVLYSAAWIPGSQEGADPWGHGPGAGVLVTPLPMWIFPQLMEGEVRMHPTHRDGSLFCDSPRSSVPSKTAVPFWNRQRQPNGFKNHWGRTRRHTMVHGIWVCEPPCLRNGLKIIKCRSLVIITAEQSSLTYSIKPTLFHSVFALPALLSGNDLFHARLCKAIAILHLEIC